MRLENTWQEIRDHSFIQNHFRSFRFPAPCWCFFSSVHLTHFLQGSGQRTGMAVAEAWYCGQWHIFVLVLRFVLGSLSCRRIHAHCKISSRNIQVLIFFLCCYLKDSMMLCKRTRCPGSLAEKLAQHIKDTAVYFIAHLGCFLSLCSPNPSFTHCDGW